MSSGLSRPNNGSCWVLDGSEDRTKVCAYKKPVTLDLWLETEWGLHKCHALYINGDSTPSFWYVTLICLSGEFLCSLNISGHCWFKASQEQFTTKSSLPTPEVVQQAIIVSYSTEVSQTEYYPELPNPQTSNICNESEHVSSRCQAFLSFIAFRFSYK